MKPVEIHKSDDLNYFDYKMNSDFFIRAQTYTFFYFEDDVFEWAKSFKIKE